MSETLEQRYANEPWGKLAIAAGYIPINTESQARYAFQFCADRIEALEAENARLKKIFNSCDWYWDPVDRETTIEGPWEILDYVKYGTVVEVERGGVVEVSYHACLPALPGSDDIWECDCSTEAEAQAAVVSEQSRRVLVSQPESSQ